MKNYLKATWTKTDNAKTLACTLSNKIPAKKAFSTWLMQFRTNFMLRMLRKDWARYCLRVVGSPSPWCTWPGSSGGPGGERRRTWRSPLYAIIVLVYISIFDPRLLSATHYPFSSYPFHYIGIILYITRRSFGNTLNWGCCWFSLTPHPQVRGWGSPNYDDWRKVLSLRLLCEGGALWYIIFSNLRPGPLN